MNLKLVTIRHPFTHEDIILHAYINDNDTYEVLTLSWFLQEVYKGGYDNRTHLYEFILLRMFTLGERFQVARMSALGGM